MSFFETAKALFPRSRAFELFIDNNKRRLVDALCELPESTRSEVERVYFDLFPDTTRVPEKWESAFSLFFTTGERAKRRDIISAMWKLKRGGQSVCFIEDTLRVIDPAFMVIENMPVSDPRNRQSVGLAICDYSTMVCDNDLARCDYLAGNSSFTPSVLQNNVSTLYAIPDDPRYWEFCFFVCKQVYRNDDKEILYIEPLDVDIVWKNFVEYLILKIKPVHSTAVVFVNWIEGDGE